MYVVLEHKQQEKAIVFIARSDGSWKVLNQACVSFSEIAFRKSMCVYVCVRVCVCVCVMHACVLAYVCIAMCA